ncbi:GNAT family N-acetyltransferase [Actinocatenispora rupis]|uniref:N-acetyltransferase n=1 Tax=Actinocatenispora rupis TaxID=519421 RepID=A0A8J3JC03_9ACTN|nr:GNAT family N-acetyltransferase [Actinocatenispora rupis]GID12033.1 N-acetyltransferase [Actinocatenispora rupis]
MVTLRQTRPTDLDHFFAFQRDPEAVRMAAFTAADPDDRAAFDAHWARNTANPTVFQRTITVDDTVVGSIATFEMDGDTEVTYWVDRAWWGKGVATAALGLLLAEVSTRPIAARVAKGNPGSLRVLERNGFRVVGEDSGFANGRGEVTGEYVLRLD